MRVEITEFSDLSDHDEDPDIAELSKALKLIKQRKTKKNPNNVLEVHERERRKNIKQALYGKLPQQTCYSIETLLAQDCYKGARDNLYPQDVTLDPCRRTALHYVIQPDIAGRVEIDEYEFCAYQALQEVLKCCPDPRLLDIYGKSAIDYCDEPENLEIVLDMIKGQRPEIYDDCVHFFITPR